MLVRGSLLWHETRTHMVVAVREETEGKWNGSGVARSKGVASSVGYRVKFSAEYKGPSRAWPKAGFTALLVNLAVCAYIFKTHFDPPGWKGSHCRRQFSIFSLYPTPVPSSAPLFRGWLLLPFHTGQSHASDQRIRTRLSPELAPFSVRSSAKKGMHQLLPVFCPLHHLAATRPTAQLNF